MPLPNPKRGHGNAQQLKRMTLYCSNHRLKCQGFAKIFGTLPKTPAPLLPGSEIASRASCSKSLKDVDLPHSSH
jgi:hypothetical protein